MRKTYFSMIISFLLLIAVSLVWGYPPGVGITSKSKNCLSCHADNGPWKDKENTILDIMEKESKKSLKQPDGTFLISAHRGETVKLLTVIGRKAADSAPAPVRNGWIFVDPTRIASNSLNKFAAGWAVDLPASCRLVGDQLEGYPKAKITVLQFTLRPADEAEDSELSWQVMLTKGEPVKGKAKEGMLGNYFEKKVILQVVD